MDFSGLESATDFLFYKITDYLKSKKEFNADRIKLLGCKYVTIWSLHYLNLHIGILWVVLGTVIPTIIIIIVTVCIVRNRRLRLARMANIAYNNGNPQVTIYPNQQYPNQVYPNPYPQQAVYPNQYNSNQNVAQPPPPYPGFANQPNAKF